MGGVRLNPIFPRAQHHGETAVMDGGPAEHAGSGSALQRRLGRVAGSWNLELTCENLTWLAVALGVILRVWEYLEFRPLYMDESALLANVADRAIFDFRHVLEGDQMAPPGFLAIERLLVQLPLDVRVTGRLFPLVCGIASVFLMRSAARRYLDRRAVPLAVGLLALGDHLLYYSAEIKQYSCDLMMALAALLAGRTPAARGAERPALQGPGDLRLDRALVLIHGRVHSRRGRPAPARDRGAS